MCHENMIDFWEKVSSIYSVLSRRTNHMLLPKGTFWVDDFPFPKGGICVRSLEATHTIQRTLDSALPSVELFSLHHLTTMESSDTHDDTFWYW